MCEGIHRGVVCWVQKVIMFKEGFNALCFLCCLCLFYVVFLNGWLGGVYSGWDKGKRRG